MSEIKSTAVEESLGDGWAEKFHLTEPSTEKLRKAILMFDLTVSHSEKSMLNDGSVALTTTLVSFDDNLDADASVVAMFDASDANDKDSKFGYSKMLEHAVEHEQPQFVIQSCEAWQAYVGSEYIPSELRVQDMPDKKEVVVNSMFCNLYGTILHLSCSQEVFRDKDTGKPIRISPIEIYETHQNQEDRGMLASFTGMILPLS